MPDFLKDVLEFKTKHYLKMHDKPTLPNKEANDFWVKFLEEELKELKFSYYSLHYGQKDYHASLTNMADALTDIIYVAIGYMLYMGLPVEEIWMAVHKANMTGKIKVESSEESKRGHLDDVRKGPDFVSPEMEIENAIRSKLNE